jgi:hypothetical protein
MKGHAPGENQEYVNGWGIFALPFESGDVLALRVFPQNDFSPIRMLDGDTISATSSTW